MKSGEYLQKKFQAWAQRQNIKLQGSERERGEPNYTLDLTSNLYEELTSEARDEFERGAGQELAPNASGICPMQALHSSAAMAVNLFHYWRRRRLFTEALRALGVPSSVITAITFERKYMVVADHQRYGFREPPHLDIGVDCENDSFRVGIECKLYEPYRNNRPELLKKPYLNLTEAWDDIPHCRGLAEQLARGDAGFHRLGPTQLIRHILGLKCDLTKKHFRLIYLYLDAPGDEAAEHRAEIENFKAITDSDGIHFVPITVQESIIRMIKLHRKEHGKYIDYLSERYV